MRWLLLVLAITAALVALWLQREPAVAPSDATVLADDLSNAEEPVTTASELVEAAAPAPETSDLTRVAPTPESAKRTESRVSMPSVDGKGRPFLPGLRGRVVDRDSGAPLEGVELSLFPTPRIDQPWRTAGPNDVGIDPAVTDADGRFRLPDLPRLPRKRTVVARGEGLATRQVRWTALETAIEAGEEVTFQMTPAVRRRGQVKFSDGHPARDVDVGIHYAHSGQGWLLHTRTDSLGRFELDLPDAAIEIEAVWTKFVRESIQLVRGDRTDLTIVLPSSTSSRILVAGIDALDVEGLELHLQGDRPSGPYTIREREAIIWMPTTRVLTAAIYAPDRENEPENGEWWFPIAVATDATIDGGVTNVLRFERPRTGRIQVTVGESTFAELGELRDVSLIGLDLHASGWRVARGRVATIEDVPVGKYEVSTTHRRGDAVPTVDVVVRAGETATASM